MKKLILLIVLAVMMFSCTENIMVKNFGGEMTIKLPKNQKLIEATWKENNLWYLTRPMREGEVPETYVFIEDSSFGAMEGQITFVESN